MTDNVCPPLGTGSVDFNALHEAAAAGANLRDALAEATTGGEPEIASTVEPAAPLPALTGKIKSELLEIASDEAVEVPHDAQNKDIIAAIEAKRGQSDVAANFVAPVGPVASDTSDDAEPTE